MSSGKRCYKDTPSLELMYECVGVSCLPMKVEFMLHGNNFKK